MASKLEDPNRPGFVKASPKPPPTNLRNFFGVDPDLSGCPFDAPPTNSKDYGEYRSYMENAMYKLTHDTGIIRFSVFCEFKDEKLRPLFSREKKKEHNNCGTCWACDHVIHQDPISPEGFYYTPFDRHFDAGYYLCATCHKLQESRKFDMDRVHMKCSMCVAESIQQIMLLKPDRCIDLRKVC